MGGTASHRVLVVDDHPGFRASAASWLTHEGQTVVGSCASGEEALPAVEELRPDLVLLDVNLPGISGVDVAEQLAKTPNPPAVIIISSDAEAGSDAQVRDAPVVGFIAKRDLTWPAIDALLC
jgi:two-component system nitrate/nitrite response regulator NarL